MSFFEDLFYHPLTYTLRDDISFDQFLFGYTAKKGFNSFTFADHNLDVDSPNIFINDHQIVSAVITVQESVNCKKDVFYVEQVMTARGKYLAIDKEGNVVSLESRDKKNSSLVKFQVTKLTLKTNQCLTQAVYLNPFTIMGGKSTKPGSHAYIDTPIKIVESDNRNETNLTYICNVVRNISFTKILRRLDAYIEHQFYGMPAIEAESLEFAVDKNHVPHFKHCFNLDKENTFSSQANKQNYRYETDPFNEAFRKPLNLAVKKLSFHMSAAFDFDSSDFKFILNTP